MSTPYNEQTTGNTSTQYHTETSGSASSTGNVTDMELTMNGMRQELEETKQCLHNISSVCITSLTKAFLFQHMYSLSLRVIGSKPRTCSRNMHDVTGS